MTVERKIISMCVMSPESKKKNQKTDQMPCAIIHRNASTHILEIAPIVTKPVERAKRSQALLVSSRFAR